MKHVDRRTGRTVVYESTPRYDPVSKQSRPIRKYLGMLDPETGELIPTSGRRGRRPGSRNRPKEAVASGDAPEGAAATSSGDERALVRSLEEARRENDELRDRVGRLERRVRELESASRSAIRALESAAG